MTASTEPSKTQGLLHGRVHLSTACLVTLAMVDLVSTLVWLNAGHAEGNPLFAFLASLGTFYFVLGKLILLIAPVCILEFARKHRPITAEVGTWVAFALYAFLYLRHIVSL